MIFLNNKVKSLLFALVVLSIVISSSCVFASDDFNQTNDVVGDDNTGYVISASGEIFISPDGTGSGISADSPTNWYNAYSSANNGDTIVFLGGNYTWNSMQRISKSITLKGYGDSESIIDALNQNGFFRTTAGSTVQLINLTFFDAETGDTGSGGIVNNGNLIVNHCYFAENTGWGTEGGAIHNSGTCNVYDSTFFSNTAKKGGSFYGEERSILNVYNSTFIKGSSKEGNCFNIKEATANIYDCQFINCSAKSVINQEHLFPSESEIPGIFKAIPRILNILSDNFIVAILSSSPSKLWLSSHIIKSLFLKFLENDNKERK